MPEACVRSAIRLRAGRRRPRSASTPTDSTTQEVCAINATAAGTTTRSEIQKNWFNNEVFSINYYVLKVVVLTVKILFKKKIVH